MAAPDPSERVAALAAIPLFAGLSDDELVPIAGSMTDKEAAEGTVLTEEGAPGEEAMILLTGTALVRRGGRVVDEMHGGDFFGEMSLINNTPRSATVIAASDVSMLVMRSDDFCSMLEDNPALSVKILRTVAARLASKSDPGTI
jgi:CRP-like cAMP-binding protein